MKYFSYHLHYLRLYHLHYLRLYHLPYHLYHLHYHVHHLLPYHPRYHLLYNPLYHPLHSDITDIRCADYSTTGAKSKTFMPFGLQIGSRLPNNLSYKLP